MYRENESKDFRDSNKKESERKNMIQKHINIKNLQGTVSLNKNILVDLAELVRISPLSSRLLFFIMGYADDNNEIITNIKTLARYLGRSKEQVEYAVKNLIKNGYITMSCIDIDKSIDIIGKEHDIELYLASNKRIWKVIGNKYIGTFKIKGKYIKLRVNKNIIKCSNNRTGNIIINIKDNLYYDTRIEDNDLKWEL